MPAVAGLGRRRNRLCSSPHESHHGHRLILQIAPLATELRGAISGGRVRQSRGQHTGQRMCLRRDHAPTSEEARAARGPETSRQ